MKVLVTGGTGYIGSHTCVELLNDGEEVIILDNLSNSKREVVNYIEEITGKKVTFYEEDCCDRDALVKIFRENAHGMILLGSHTVEGGGYQHRIGGRYKGFLSKIRSEIGFKFKHDEPPGSLSIMVEFVAR